MLCEQKRSKKVAIREILKIGHHAKATAFAITSFWVKN